MRFKKLSKQKILLFITIAFIFFLGLLFYFILNYKKGNSKIIIKDTTLISKQEQINYGLPVHLKIPQINTDAGFEYVGLASDGSMDVPKGPADVGWFNLGPHPGEKGSAIIAGHSGWKDGVPAVFDNLYKLQLGDKIYIEDEKGTIITFVVRGIKKYKPTTDAIDVFESSDGLAHLNLITCTGTWDFFKKSRPDRLVVFADKE